MKIRNCPAIGHLIDTLKFTGQLGIPFGRQRDSGRFEPVSDINDEVTSTGSFRAILQLHSVGNSELAAHVEESRNAAYLNPDIQIKLITIIGEEILSSYSSEVKDASCFAVVQFVQIVQISPICPNQSNLEVQALADTILSHLKYLNLPLKKMINQDHDRTSSVSGKQKGV